MITCDRASLIARCRQRGYSLDEVMPCVVAQDGRRWTIDETHPAYPAARRDGNAFRGLDGGPPKPPQKAVGHGPGTELKKLLSRVGIRATPTCACNRRANQMDAAEAREPGWCEAHLDTIVGWLREEAEKRRLPFVDAAGRLLVRRAIRNAKRAAAS